jgi:DNA-binding response OmpR family regulator
MATVLAIDKDPLQLDLLSFLLQQEGHKVYATPEPDTAFDMLQSKLIDLVLVETVLQRHDGFRVCQQIRQLNPYTPLMIVSERGDEEHIVKGLEAAADDYVTKPYSPRQFLARVHALLRRARDRSQAAQQTYADAILHIDFAQRAVRYADRSVQLTPLEFKLLSAFVRNPNHVLSADQLLELVWGDTLGGSREQVKVYVGYLRRKLDPIAPDTTPIETVRGFGYRYQRPG